MRQLVILAFLVATTSSVASSNQLRQKSTNQNIRKFDLKKLAYREAVKTLRQDWAEAVRFMEKNGDKDDWVQEKNIEGFEAKSTYGDITGDRSDDAAVSVYYGLGGSGSFTGVFVYTLRDGSPSLV